MGIAKVMFQSGESMSCEREGGENRDAADDILREVGVRKGKKGAEAFVHCDNGGGFDANVVVGVTVNDEEPEAAY